MKHLRHRWDIADQRPQNKREWGVQFQVKNLMPISCRRAFTSKTRVLILLLKIWEEIKTDQ